MVALREAQRLLNRPRSVSFIFVDVIRSRTTPTRCAHAIEPPFPRRPGEPEQRVRREHRRHGQAQMATFAAVIGILAMLVGGIVVANTMMMSIYERTREIGTLRALGWPKRRILSQVVQESLWLCLVSAVLGSIMGVSAVGHQPRYRTQRTHDYGPGMRRSSSMRLS